MTAIETYFIGGEDCMSRIKDRDQLVAQLSREFPDRSLYDVIDLARKLLRAGATLQRLAEAQCNGYWPADNGTPERSVQCGRCQSGWHRSALKRYPVKADTAGVNTIGSGKTAYYLLCVDCRTQDHVTALLKPYGMTPIFNGDPRGAVLLIVPPSYAERNAGKSIHNLEGIYVS